MARRCGAASIRVGGGVAVAGRGLGEGGAAAAGAPAPAPATLDAAARPGAQIEAAGLGGCRGMGAAG
eukprot:7355365-Prymnesium_polylepis.1